MNPEELLGEILKDIVTLESLVAFDIFVTDPVLLDRLELREDDEEAVDEGEAVP